MIERRRIKKITAYTAVLLLVVQILAAPVCWADDLMHTSVRDSTLYIAVPSSWQIEEFGSIDEDAETVENDERAYKMLELQDQGGAKQGEMWICADPYDNSFFYCNTEEKTEEYLEDAGDDAIEYVLETAFPDADNWSRSDTKYLKEEDDFTYVIRQNAKVDGKKYLLYLACDFTTNGGIHEVLLFEDPFDQKVCDQIAESLQGYGYAVELIDNRIDGGSGGDDSGGDSGTPEYYFDNDTETGPVIRNIICAIFTIAVFGFIYKFLRNGVQAGRQVKRTKPSFENAVMGRSSNRQGEKRFTPRAIDKWTLKEKRKGKCDHEDMHIQTGTRYSGYQESLRTLHKSGLLTTKEMHELLEKHKNDL